MTEIIEFTKEDLDTIIGGLNVAINSKKLDKSTEDYIVQIRKRICIQCSTDFRLTSKEFAI